MVKQLKYNLLGLPTIKVLHLLVVVDDVGDDPAGSIKQHLSSLSTGLGTLQGDYEIKLWPDAEPFSLGTARNIPLPIQSSIYIDKVKQEVNNMEVKGVIS